MGIHRLDPHLSCVLRWTSRFESCEPSLELWTKQENSSERGSLFTRRLTLGRFSSVWMQADQRQEVMCCTLCTRLLDAASMNWLFLNLYQIQCSSESISQSNFINCIHSKSRIDVLATLEAKPCWSIHDCIPRPCFQYVKKNRGVLLKHTLLCYSIKILKNSP